MVDQVRIDRVLQVSAPVVRQEDVDDFGPGIRPVARILYGVVDGVDDVWVWIEERVGFCFFECEGDGLLAEGTADLLQGVERRVAGVLDEVDVGEATLGE